MLQSKATAALMRLREIDRKYRIKQNEVKRLESNVSTESTPESPPSTITDLPREEEGSSNVPSRQKLEVQMPEARLLSAEEPSIKETDSSVVTENLGSDSNGSSVVSRTKEAPKDSTVLEVGEKKEESSRNASSSSKSRSEVSEIAESPETVASVDESIVRRSKDEEDFSGLEVENAGESKSQSNETTIDEVIGGFSEEKSEVAYESIGESTKEEVEEDGRGSRRSSEVEEVQAEKEVGYESDTFEDASSSIDSSGSKSSDEAEVEMNSASEEEVGTESSQRSGVKQIEIIPHEKFREKSYEKNLSEDRDKRVVELVPPKPMETSSECEVGLDEELSNYVKTIETIDVDPREVPVSLLKVSAPTSSPKKPRKKINKRQGRSSRGNADETEKFVDSTNRRNEKSMETARSSRKVVEGHVSRKDSRKNVQEEEKVSSEGKEVSTKKLRNEKTENSELESKPEEEGSNEGMVDAERTSVASFFDGISEEREEDATSVLRRLNRDAIDAIARRQRISVNERATGKSRRCQKCGTMVLSSSASDKVEKTNNKIVSPKGDVETSGRSGGHGGAGRRVRTKTKDRKSARAQKPVNHGRVDEKCSKFESRHARHSRKRMAELRTRRDREDIRNYLLEIELARLRLGQGESSFLPSKTPTFVPLDFPKIANFAPDTDDTELKSMEQIAGLRGRVSTIRQWLKDQYVLYRKYSSLAQALNAKYVPTSLEDAKQEEKEEEEGETLFQEVEEAMERGLHRRSGSYGRRRSKPGDDDFEAYESLLRCLLKCNWVKPRPRIVQM